MLTTLLLSVIPVIYLLVMLLPTLLKPGRTPPPAPADPLAAMALPPRGSARLLRPRRTLRLMKKALRLPEDQSAVTVLRSQHQALTAALLTLRRDMRRPPLLPCTQDGEIRMLALAREALRHGQPDAALLLRMLENFHQHGHTTLEERMALPLCLRVLLADKLTRTLEKLLDTAVQTQRGRKLAASFARQKNPADRLDRHPLSLPCLSALLTALRARSASEALSRLNEWLSRNGSSAAAIARQEAQEQSRLAGNLTRITAAFQALEQLGWPKAEESISPLHKQFEADPSGIYPQMTPDSRLTYRRRAAWLARLFHADEAALAQSVLDLCEKAPRDALERHIGWYLLEWEGVRVLRRRLHSRRGLTGAFAGLQAGFVYRAGLWVLALAFSAWILGRGYTLWLLPPLLTVTGQLCRAIWGPLAARWTQPRILPCLQLERLKDDMRTLVVLPAAPADRHEAILAVKQLATARRAMPEEGVDYLLLTDWNDSMTQRGGDDDSIALAISAAIDALNDEEDRIRFYYLHRARSWSQRRRVFTASEGRQGAIGMLCRLIAAGETDETIDFASLDPSELHRRYAWVMVLESGAKLEPGSLLTLAGVMAHPLNTRVNTSSGYRGFSLLGARVISDPNGETTRLQCLTTRSSGRGGWPLLTGHGGFSGIGLIRPDALLEGVDGWIQPESLTSAAWLAGELSGCAIGPVTACRATPATLNDQYIRAHEHARQVWQLLPWLAPFVKTPGGVRRNPLRLPSRFALRERFRGTLLPLCQIIALIACFLHRDFWLLSLTLLAPRIERLLHWRGWQALLAETALLPMRAYTRADAAVRAVLGQVFPARGQRPLLPDHLFTIELCAQIAVCVLLTVLSTLRFPIFLPGLLLAGVIACFPIVRRRLDEPLRAQHELSSAATSQLTDIAAATWRFFEQTVTHDSRWLPPESLQTHPDVGPAATTTPEAIGLYLLSSLAAREMGLIGTAELSNRVAQTMDSLEQLPRWQGLLAARYRLDDSASKEPEVVPAAANGLLCACLLTVAQGLRAFLPETDENAQNLPARVDAFAAGMRLHVLYDVASGLFHAFADPLKGVQDAPLLDLFADESLLLSFVAAIRREVPFSHLDRLRRTLVQVGFRKPMLTRHGSAAETLLPWLLLPAGIRTLPGRSLRDAVHLQIRYALDGLFGVGMSAYHAFDEDLRYASRPFGIPETALDVTPFQPVFAPYACALCLPFAPQLAADSLQQMRALGMFGRLGFLDAVDFSPSRVPEESDFVLTRVQSAAHQGMLLCAVCNALTGNALSRCFTDIPMADACTLLLYRDTKPLILPQPQRYPLAYRPPEPAFRRDADPAVSPADAHLIGTGRVGVLVNAQGNSVIRIAGRDVTRFTGRPDAMEGPQLYLSSGERTERLLCPALPGTCVFSEGMARFTRQCGDMDTVVTLLIDPVAGAAIQVVELTNQTPVERTITLGACLVPALPGTAVRTRDRMLALDSHGMTLIHSLHTQEPLLSLDVQTDMASFIGHGTSDHPGWLHQDAPAGVVGAYLSPCLAFRAGILLRGHGKASVMFATRLISGRLTGYTPPDMPHLILLSRLSARSLADSLPLSQEQVARISRLTGALMWQEQVHQGPVRPLTLPVHHLSARGLNPDRPILTVTLSSGDGLSLLREATEAASWLLLSGRSVTLCAACVGADAAETAALAEELLSTTILRRHPEGSACVLDDLSEAELTTLCAVSRLVLMEGHGSAEDQLISLTVPLSKDELPSAAPGRLPDPEPLLFDDGLSGFDPQTGDCVVCLEPGRNAPSRWRLPLSNGRYATQATTDGLGFSSAEQRLICHEEAFILGEDGGGLFSATPAPLGRNLPWQVRFSPGVAVWRTRTDVLDVTLTAAAIPRRTAGLRTLRLRNMTDREQRFTVHIAVSFALGADSAAPAQTFLTPVIGGVTAVSPLLPVSGFVTLMEGGCISRVMTEADRQGVTGIPPLPDAPNALNGAVALLSVETSLLVGGSTAVTWMTGYAQQGDDIELLLHRMRRSGASAVYRSIRQRWGQRAGAMTFATPEPGFDLLLNHWLPCQFLAGDQPLTLSAQSLLTPSAVRPRLLLAARDHAADDLLPWLTACYVRMTGDEAALNDLVPHDADRPMDARDTLYARCLQALKSDIADGLQGLFLRCAALRDFAEIADEPDQVELLTLLKHCQARAENAWHGHGYAEQPGRIDALTAAWSVLGLGVSTRTAETVREAVAALYDPMHGLIAANSEPGTPQDTLAAAWLTVALARLGWSDRAWELARALNPIYHTDDPERTAEYRGEPYAMAAQVYAQAPHTGQASRESSPEAAAVMYLLMVEELLGFQRHGNRVTLRPMVPDDWEDFSITLRVGASIWHFQFDGRALCIVDGETAADAAILLTDDGGVHEVQAPLRAGVVKAK